MIINDWLEINERKFLNDVYLLSFVKVSIDLKGKKNWKYVYDDQVYSFWIDGDRMKQEEEEEKVTQRTTGRLRERENGRTILFL